MECDMFLKKFLDLIYADKKDRGFMVHFERVEGRMLRTDYFPSPDLGQKLIRSEQIAWRLAEEFAKKTVGECVEIYVVKHDFSPVAGWQSKRIDNRKSESA